MAVFVSKPAWSEPMATRMDYLSYQDASAVFVEDDDARRLDEPAFSTSRVSRIRR